MEMITYDKFISDRLRNVDSMGVENGLFSLTKPVAVNTGPRDCAACDQRNEVETKKYKVSLFMVDCGLLLLKSV